MNSIGITCMNMQYTRPELDLNGIRIPVKLKLKLKLKLTPGRNGMSGHYANFNSNYETSKTEPRN